MIKTSYKSKPISGLTHSIGTKQISELLSGIRLYDELTIAFDKEEGQRMGTFTPGFSMQKIKGDSKDLLKFHRLISANYSENLDKWSIHLNAVKIENNLLVKTFLIKTGLPLLRDWLESKKSDTWFSGYRYYLIGLNENMSEYCIWETHNDRTINKKTEKINCA